MQAIGMDIESAEASADERIAQNGARIALVEPADISVFAAGEPNAVESFPAVKLFDERAEHLAAARGSVVAALLPAVPDPERLIDGRDIFYGYALADKMLGNIGTVFGKRRIVLLFYIFSEYLILVNASYGYSSGALSGN